MPDTLSYYDVLGVGSTASLSDIKKAYRKLARELHPDMGGSTADKDRFAQVSTAYAVLMDVDKRDAYDTSRTQSFFDSEDFIPPSPRRPSFTKNDEPAPEVFDSNTFVEVPFVADRLTWWEKVDPEAKVTVTPAFAPASSTALPFWALSLLGALISAGMGYLAQQPLALIGGAGLGLSVLASNTALGRRGVNTPLGEFPLIFLAAVASLAALGLYIWRGEPTITTLAGIGVGTLVAAAGAMRVRGVTSKQRRLASLDVMVDRDIVTFDHLKAKEDDSVLFDDMVLSARRLTTTLLTPLVEHIPGCRLIDGVPYPGVAARSIDHALVVGRRVALIENKIEMPGRYDFDGRSALTVNGSRFLGGELRTAQALTGWRSLLPGYEVAAFVIVHPLPAGPVKIVAPANTMFDVVPSDRAREAIGSWLSDGEPVVDRHLLVSLLTARPVQQEKWEVPARKV